MISDAIKFPITLLLLLSIYNIYHATKTLMIYFNVAWQTYAHHRVPSSIHCRRKSWQSYRWYQIRTAAVQTEVTQAQRIRQSTLSLMWGQELRQLCPVNGRLALLNKKFVAAREMTATEEPAIGWQRWWVHSREYVMFLLSKQEQHQQLVHWSIHINSCKDI